MDGPKTKRKTTQKTTQKAKQKTRKRAPKRPARPERSAPRRRVPLSAKPKDKAAVEALGEAMRQRRLEMGLTLAEFSERADRTPNYIGTIEHGARDFSLSTLASLADGFGISICELLGPPAPLKPAGIEMANIFQAAPPDMQEAVLRTLLSLKRHARR